MLTIYIYILKKTYVVTMLIVENVYVVVNMYATHSYPVEQKQGVGRSG